MRSNSLLQGTVLFAACAALGGCSLGSTTRAAGDQLPSLPAGTYGNWQFQTGSSLTASGIIHLSGPLEIANGAISGQLETAAPCSQTEPRTFSGTLNATTGALTLTTATPGVEGQFTMASASAGTGTLAGGAMGYDAGYSCLALIGPTPSIAVEIPTLTGTYTGTVTSTTGATATATLTLSQSVTPNTAAAFPLTATLQFTAGSCSASSSLSGSISGASYSLASATATGASVSGLDNAGGQTLPAVSILVPAGSCGGAGTLTGTLTLQ
jgi:hypothetical protein